MFDLRETFFNISKGNVDPLASFTFILFVRKLLLWDIVFPKEVPGSSKLKNPPVLVTCQ